MKPIPFPEQTKILAPLKSRNAKQLGGCVDLPVALYNGQVISCWKLSWKERFKMLLCGKLWVFVVSGETQPPIGFHVGKTVF